MSDGLQRAVSSLPDRPRVILSRSLLARVASAAVLAPLSLALIWIGDLPFGLFIVTAGALMAFEWCRLTSAAVWFEPFLLHAAAIAAAVLLTLEGHAVAAVAAVAAAAAAGAVLALRAGRPAVWPAFGIPYIAIPCVAFVWLRELPESGLETILWLLAVVWTTDTMALVSGRALGGPRLAPRWSPRKTWAGLAGGVAAATAVGAAGGLLLPESDPVRLAVVALLLATIAQAGDVTESALKRHFGVKDASRLIPGHGGALDRLDGLLFASAALAGLVLWAGASPLVWSQ